MKEKMTLWFWVRTTIVLLSALSAKSMVGPEILAESNVTWIVAPIIGVVTLLFMSVVGMVAVRVSKTGHGPRWQANPFKSFIDFVHLGAWSSLAGGLGAVAFWLISIPEAGPLAVTYLALGVSCIIGIRIGTAFGERTVHNKIPHGIVANAPNREN